MEKKTTIKIKNMCCDRCIMAVTDVLKRLGLQVESVKLGEAIYAKPPVIANENYNVLIEKRLKEKGFELIIDHEEKIVESIKIAIIELIHYVEGNGEKQSKLSHSKYIAQRLGKPYRYLSALFSKYKAMTIEKYIILQRIEKAKELIEYGDLSFSEISFKLGYKSPQHLSRQFKEIVGISMRNYKNKQDNKRNTIDKI